MSACQDNQDKEKLNKIIDQVEALSKAVDTLHGEVVDLNSGSCSQSTESENGNFKKKSRRRLTIFKKNDKTNEKALKAGKSETKSKHHCGDTEDELEETEASSFRADRITDSLQLVCRVKTCGMQTDCDDFKSENQDKLDRNKNKQSEKRKSAGNCSHSKCSTAPKGKCAQGCPYLVKEKSSVSFQEDQCNEVTQTAKDNNNITAQPQCIPSSVKKKRNMGDWLRSMFFKSKNEPATPENSNVQKKNCKCCGKRNT